MSGQALPKLAQHVALVVRERLGRVVDQWLSPLARGLPEGTLWRIGCSAHVVRCVAASRSTLCACDCASQPTLRPCVTPALDAWPRMHIAQPPVARALVARRPVVAIHLWARASGSSSSPGVLFGAEWIGRIAQTVVASAWMRSLACHARRRGLLACGRSFCGYASRGKRPIIVAQSCPPLRRRRSRQVRALPA